MSAVGTGISCFLLAALISILPLQRVKRYAYVFSSFGAVSFGLYAVSIISARPSNLYALNISSAYDFVFYGDAISGFFMLAISVLAFAVSIYSVDYVKDMDNKGAAGILYNFFILSMYAVVLSGNIITFLISWETMSIISYFLVTFDRKEESARAGLMYAVMTHVGTAFIIALFLILYKQTGSMDLAVIKSMASQIPDALKNLIFIFSIIGFGTKAGIIPLHTWLPRAHPAAPSNISALMSGVMIKTGIYGLIRINLDIMQQGPEWWGLALIVIGAVSCILGVLYALTENDMKRLLAYCSVENIGVIFLGIGAAMMLKSNGFYISSALALTAALYHTLNHALFKGLLFLGAGSVIHGTHTKNIEEMGGLLKSMPYTGALFLVGSVSICALPPFNGFVSEWLTYQALLSGFNSMSIISKIISPLGGAALALTGALAAACFVKMFGIAFLGLPRSSHAAEAKESSPLIIVGMSVLALLCLLLGIFPGMVVRIISPAVFSYTGADSMLVEKGFLHVGETFSSLSPAAILITIIIMFIAAVIIIFIVGGKRGISYGDSWDCGINKLTPRMQYTSTAFTKPLRMIFKRIYRPRRELRISYIMKPFFVQSIKYRSEITPFFEKYIYSPGISIIRTAAGWVRVIQSGSLHLYLAYILATLILLLVLGTR